jgi:hypothetical protein
MSRIQLAEALGRVGLLKPTFRAYERLASLRVRSESGEDDRLPVPPRHLRMGVICTPSLERFLESGRQGIETIEEYVRPPHAIRDTGPVDVVRPNE